jgi:hypothetical protein
MEKFELADKRKVESNRLAKLDLGFVKFIKGMRS